MRPIQNLNGYSKPWIGGLGTNQLDYTTRIATNCSVAGTADDFTATVGLTGNSVVTFSLPAEFEGKTIYVSGTFTRPGTHTNTVVAQIQRTLNGSTSYSTVGNYSNGQSSLIDSSYSVPAGATNIKLRVILNLDGASSDFSGEEVHVTGLRVCTETGQAWSPYENICPIYGHTAATVTRIGRNFLENNCATNTFSSGVTVTVNSNGVFTINGTLASAAVLYYNIQTGATTTGSQRDRTKHFPNGSYMASVIGDVGVRLQVQGYNEGGSLNTIRAVNGGESLAFTIDNTYQYNYCRLYLTAGTYSNATARILVTLASDTSTVYEAYNGNEYETLFNNTVYGGTLDFITGTLTKTWDYIASYNGEALPAEWISDRDEYAAGATPTTGAEVAYRLATPQTFQLTPQEITTLLGTNNIWATTTTNEP